MFKAEKKLLEFIEKHISVIGLAGFFIIGALMRLVTRNFVSEDAYNYLLGWYDDIKISKVEVKTSGSDSWTDLGAETLDYAGSGTAGTALFATLADAETGFLAQNATAIRITFGKPNNVAQYYAEIEVVGHAEQTQKDVVFLFR